jgi:hypothetical protein
VRLKSEPTVPCTTATTTICAKGRCPSASAIGMLPSAIAPIALLATMMILRSWRSTRTPAGR